MPLVSELDDALPDGDGDRFQLGVGAELGKDRLDVLAHGVDAEEKLVRHGLVLGSLCQQVQHRASIEGEMSASPAWAARTAEIASVTALSLVM